MKKIYLVFFVISFLCFNPLHAQFTNVMIDNNSNPEEPSITINPLNPMQLVAGSNIDNSYYSSDGGATWITGYLFSSLGDAGDPCLIADSLGNFFYLHLVPGIDRVVCQKSTDGGVSYSDGSYTTANTLLEDKEWGVVDRNTNNVYVTWTEYDNPSPIDSTRIYFARSIDNGASFSNGIRINQYSGDCEWLDVTDPHPFVGPNSEIYVTFMDSDGIRFNKSLDTGITWLAEQPLIESGCGPFRYNPMPGVSRIRSMPYSSCDLSNSLYRGNLYVSWADQRNGVNNSDIFFIKSSDEGNTWTPALKINSDNSNNQQYRSAMAVDQSNGYIYIVFYDRRNYPTNDSTDVFLAKSTDGGDHWTDFKISNTGFYSTGSPFDGDYIDIAAHDGIVRPIWTAINGFSSGVWTCLYNEKTVGIPSLLNAKSNFNFTVNPNPAHAVAAVSFTNEVENQNGAIMDAAGRIVSTFNLNHVSEKVLDLRDLSSGMYFVKVGNITRKLFIEK